MFKTMHEATYFFDVLRLVHETETITVTKNELELIDCFVSLFHCWLKENCFSCIV